jgi:hypothetical protein
LTSDLFDIIAPNETREKVFAVSMTVHQAPVWIQDKNVVIVSPQNQSYQIVINLNQNPVLPIFVSHSFEPIMSNLTAKPLRLIPTGCYVIRSIIYGVNGINMTSPPGLFPDTYVADGLKVSHSDYVFTAAGSTFHVVRPSDGVLLGKISTGTEVMNLVAIQGREW